MSARTIAFPSEPVEELRTGALQGRPTSKAARTISDSMVVKAIREGTHTFFLERERTRTLGRTPNSQAK